VGEGKSSRVDDRHARGRAARGVVAALGLFLACGGDVPRFPGLVRVSAGASPFPAGCAGPAARGEFLQQGSEVEPSIAVDPRDAGHLVAVWQQDRWSIGGAAGIVTGVSRDGGRTWSRTAAHFTRCTGGTAANGGDYDRASDPWVSFSPDGTVHQIAVAFDGAGGGRKAILASRSTDGGATWSDPAALQRDTDPDFEVDKETITADPRDARLVYAVWDRLTGQASPDPALATGPAWFARSADGGATWEGARAIFDPGADAQTIGNQIAVLPDGALLDLLVVVAKASSASPASTLAVLRSTDQGDHWTAPVAIAAMVLAGTRDPGSGAPIRSGEDVPAIAVDPVSGKVYVAWQDARFSGGARDGVALAASADGGATWSAPAQANQAPDAQAFTPALAATPAGRLGLLYLDLRRDDPGGAGGGLLAAAWLATSDDGGATWREALLGAPFDLRGAPLSDGYFLGDYQGLAAAGESFAAALALAVGSPEDAADVYVKTP